jgi:16S rRNA (guanine966-N2)-methyltransferase
MRIIAGRAKGRTLASPRGPATRPLTGRAREAVFSSLGDSVIGATVLDAYAGAGSIGLEALSRGAVSAVFMERSRSALAVIRRNVERVGLGGTIVPGDVVASLSADANTYDFAFVDPPYDTGNPEVEAVLAAMEGRLGRGAWVVVHRRTGTPLPAPPPFLRLVDRRRYGDGEVLRFVEEQP